MTVTILTKENDGVDRYEELVPMGEKPEKNYPDIRQCGDVSYADKDTEDFFCVLENKEEADWMHPQLAEIPGYVDELDIIHQDLIKQGTKDSPPEVNRYPTGKKAYRFLRGALKYSHTDRDELTHLPDDYCFSEVDHLVIHEKDGEFYICTGWGYDEVGSCWIPQRDFDTIMEKLGYVRKGD